MDYFMCLLESQDRERKIFLNKVIQGIIKQKLIVTGDRLLLGYSGGPDSQFLFHLLLQLEQHISFHWQVVHIHHQLRESANRDEAFCKSMAKEHHIKYHLFKVDVKTIAKHRGESIESCARDIRYEAFEKVSREESLNKIVTAHHLNDNAETFVQRLLRGSSIYGLRGIEKQLNNRIRPLLKVKKSSILSYLQKEEIPYCIDETNAENDYFRNRVRNQYFKVLERIEPDIQEKIATMQEELADIHEDMLKFLHPIYTASTLEVERLKEFTPYVQRLILSQFLHSYQVSLQRKELEKLITWLFSGKSSKQQIQERELYIENGCLKVEKKVEMAKDVVLTLHQERYFSKYRVTMRVCPVSSEKQTDAIYLSGKCQNMVFTLRNRKPGDYIFIKGYQKKKKLKDVMINDKIALSHRSKVILLCCHEEVIWMYPTRVSDHYRVEEKDHEMLEIIIKEER